MGRIRTTYETEGRRVARSVARKLVRGLRLSPNVVTVSGTILNGVAALIAYHHHFLIAAAVFLVGSLLDAMDGAIAKVTGRITAFGAFLDSTFDRVSEGLVLGGLGLMFSAENKPWYLAACFVALAGSYLVSYTRARAEALGIDCKVGLASRTERVVLLTAGLFFAQFWAVSIEIVVAVLAVTAVLTVVQRMAHVHGALPGGRKPRPEMPTNE